MQLEAEDLSAVSAKGTPVLGWLGGVAVVGALIAPLSGVLAADPPTDVPPPIGQVHPKFFDLNGWYMRVDTGYAWAHVASAQAAPGYTNPTDNSLGNSLIASLGGGIKTHWLRTDAAVDYTAPLKYSGTAATSAGVTAKVAGVSALINGYIDLGKWHGVTPYIGTGAGAGYMSVFDYASTVVPPFSGGDQSQWNFNWAAMAGLGYAVVPGLLLDAGYRYLSFGDVETENDAFGQTTSQNLAAHEVRVGMRWSFDDAMLAK